MSAFRPHDNLIAGELDNTQPGRVKGWLTFVGMSERVKLDLRGDFHRDIRGTVIRLHNENPEPRQASYMDNFATEQTGDVGDMTAGLEPKDYVDYPYFEWYSDQNGRVVLELSPVQIQVIGTPIPWQQEPPISRSEQQQNFGNWLTKLADALSTSNAAGSAQPESKQSTDTQQAEAERAEPSLNVEKTTGTAVDATSPSTSSPQTFLELSEGEFATHYPLLSNHLHPESGCRFKTFGPQGEWVMNQDPQCVWTLLVREGDTYLRSGVHPVNRIGYYVSSRPVPEGTTVQVPLGRDMDQEEDHEISR
jgi:hypothetical protein